MTFPDEILSLDSRWRGQVTAEMVVPNGNGKRIPLAASTQQGTWGKYQIEATGNKKSQPLWAKVRLPDDPAIGGKSVKISVAMVVTYPVELMADPNQRHRRVFDDRQQRVERTVEVNVAPYGATDSYKQLNLIGTLTGSVIVFAVIGLLMLSAAFAHKPSSAMTLQQLTTVRDDAPKPENQELPAWMRGRA
jgi:hypothetical protein